MVVFTLVFGKFANFPSNGVPYPIFTYSALLPWTYFASSVALSSAQPGLEPGARDEGVLPARPPAARRRHRPDRRLPPRVRRARRDDGRGSSVWPSWRDRPRARCSSSWRLSPRSGSGSSSRRSNVRYRDVPYAIPFLIQIWLFLSGVVYAISALPEKWQWLLALNPMTAVISGFQWGRRRHARARSSGKTLVSIGADCSCSSSSGSGTSAAPSPASRTRSDGDRDLTSRSSRRATGSASSRARYGTLRDSLAAAAPPARPSRAPAPLRGDLGAPRRLLRGPRGRGARRHRAERRGQVDAAQDPHPHHDADARGAPRSADASAACSRSGPASIPSSRVARTSS